MGEPGKGEVDQLGEEDAMLVMLPVKIGKSDQVIMPFCKKRNQSPFIAEWDVHPKPIDQTDNQSRGKKSEEKQDQDPAAWR